jgi:hypothetical protein
MTSLTRSKAITKHCFECIYDQEAAGTNRQQVTLCSVRSCPLYPFRPTTKSLIPESVLTYYQVTGAERAYFRSPDAVKRGFVEGKPGRICSGKGGK